MAPTIRVDDEVYEFLKERAEPFVDTPNAVLRRALGLGQPNGNSSAPDDGPLVGKPVVPPAEPRRRGKRTRKRQRATRGTLVPQEEYELPLLQVLDEKGGRAQAKEATDAVGERLDAKFGDVDREKTSSGEIRWRNRTQFARLALVESGDLKGDSPRGVWELTEKGSGRAQGGSQ